MNVEVEEPGANNIHSNAFYAKEDLLQIELQAQGDYNPLTACSWIVRALHPWKYLVQVV